MWTKPIVEEVDIRLTANGVDPYSEEVGEVYVSVDVAPSTQAPAKKTSSSKSKKKKKKHHNWWS